jgi:hypothetical protein
VVVAGIGQNTTGICGWSLRIGMSRSDLISGWGMHWAMGYYAGKHGPFVRLDNSILTQCNKSLKPEHAVYFIPHNCM